jgi:YHS domain-containing protein
MRVYGAARLSIIVGCALLFAGCGGGALPVSADGQGLALGGYDVMSYYQGGERRGSADYHYNYHGATFLFTSAVNRERFAAAPETFMPQYGGHCAFGMGFGMTIEGDPQAYTLDNGRLYFNASPVVKYLWRGFGDVKAADAEWRRLREGP